MWQRSGQNGESLQRHLQAALLQQLDLGGRDTELPALLVSVDTQLVLFLEDLCLRARQAASTETGPLCPRLDPD